MIDGTSEAQINSDLVKARDLGVRGTPSFALGTIQQDGKVLVQKLIMGAQPLAVFEREIDDLHVLLRSD
jgi:hypothetical protein